MLLFGNTNPHHLAENTFLAFPHAFGSGSIAPSTLIRFCTAEGKAVRPLSVFVLVCVLSPEIALGQDGFLSGNELYQKCTAEAVGKSYCVGYVTGIADVMQISKSLCVPDGVTVGQMVDVIVKYLRDHPEKRHYSVAAATFNTLSQTFPCPK
jgi:hypothetical protein